MLQLYDGKYMFYLCCKGHDVGKPPHLRFLRAYYVPSAVLLFSYLTTVTITGDRAADLDLCLALTAFSSEGTFTCHNYCDTGPPFLKGHIRKTRDPHF